MSEIAKIEITINEDDETKEVNVSFSTSNLNIFQMNYWLDHVKMLALTGQFSGEASSTE